MPRYQEDVPFTMKTYQKILLTILLAVLAVLASYLFGCNEPTVNRTSSNEPTQRALLNAYQAYNREYFYGGLPEDKTTIKLVDNLKGNHGEDIMASATHRGDGSWLIEIDRQSHALEKQAEMSEVHEMCHQSDIISGNDEGLDSHSNAFEACMLSVAKRGGFKGTW